MLVSTTVVLTSLAQTTYYVASTGNDANDGRSINFPFRSLNRANKVNLQPGDSLFFRRGDTFRGTLSIRQSGTPARPIIVDAYGNGSKPVLAGSVPVKNWINVGSHLWQASCPECGNRVTGVYRNDLPLPLGRYPNPDAPNRGYLTGQSHVGTMQLTSQQALTTDWTGAEAVLFPTYWIIDRATITQQNGNTLTLNNPSTYTLTDSWGLLIQNHPATLDQMGEWYYNPKNQLLSLYCDQGNPNDQAITATAADRSIDITNASFVTIKNLHITQAKSENLFAANVSGLVLTNDDFTDAGEDGIVFQGTGSDILVENSTITEINNNGIYIGSYQNVTFRRNTLRHIGLLPNRGKSGDGQFTAFQSFAMQNSLIENNVIDSVGYIGFSIFSNTTIRQNVVSNFCMTKSDGGGIYLWNGGQLPLHNILIQSNIIQKGIGTTGAVVDTVYYGAHGIFLDDCVEAAALTDNTVSDCHGLGIYLHAVNHVSLLRNTCFNNSVAQLILYNYQAPCLPRNNTLKQNILVAKAINPYVAGYISGANDLSDFGSMTQNYYARPFDDVFTIRAVYNQTVVNNLSLTQWQAQFNQDLMSKTSPITYKDYRIKSLSSHNLVNSTFLSTSEGWSGWSPYSNEKVGWTTGGSAGGGSLQLNFSGPSGHTDSYELAYKNIQSVTKSKSYLLRFEAKASAPKKIVVFIRQQNAPYQDLTRRYELLAGTTKKKYELAFTALASEANAFLTVQLEEDDQSVWLNNVWLQEGIIEPVNPDDMIRLLVNPTIKDSVMVLDSPCRDVKNHYYARYVVLKPFTSVVLLKDSLPPVDVNLSLKTNSTDLKVGDIVSLSLSLHIESAGRTPVANQVQWACRLPANLTLMNGSGLSYSDSVLRGTVQQLSSDTIFVFRVKAIVAGRYELAAQVTAATYGDPDSTPDSGVDDGEDDAAIVTLFVRERTLADTTALVTATSSVVSGIEKNRIYPNPTGSEFAFVAEADITAFQVVDLLGRERLNLGGIRQSQVIRFGHQLPTGHYLLYIQYKTGEQRTVKLVKLDG